MALVAGLWLYSGRQTFTRSELPVIVAERDDLFGDVQTRVEMTPGPIFGWYVGGLDAVLGTALFAALSSGIAALVTRRAPAGRKDHKESTSAR